MINRSSAAVLERLALIEYEEIMLAKGLTNYPSYVEALEVNRELARIWAARKLRALQVGDYLSNENIVVPKIATKKMLQAAHDGPLMADEDHMDEKTEVWLQEMYKAMIKDSHDKS